MVRLVKRTKRARRDRDILGKEKYVLKKRNVRRSSILGQNLNPTMSSSILR